jgi:hypothetical protein
MIGGRRAVPLFNYILAFALQLRKGTENLSKGSRVELDTTRCVDLATFFGAASTGLLSIGPPQLNVGDFRQPLIGTTVFHVAELRGSPHQLTLSRNSQLVLWCGRWRMQSPNPREFACY